MMNRRERLGFSVSWKVTCARRVHREIKKSLRLLTWLAGRAEEAIWRRSFVLAS
jgi:hypothetical protein